MKINYIIETLKENGFVVHSHDDDFSLLENGEVMVSIVSPHSGNGNKILIRSDFKEIFDKWGNAPFEWFVDDLTEFDSEIIFTLLGMVVSSKANDNVYKKFLTDI